MKDTLIGFAKKIGIEVFGFVLARVLDAIPEGREEEIGGKGGDFFQEYVTPWIGEGNEQRIQQILWGLNKGFNEHCDLIEE
jgi:hypothetical protein